MNNEYFIGVDGGGSKTLVRLEDVAGKLLGEEKGGPANINLSVSEAWASVYAALNPLLARHKLSLTDPKLKFYASMGLAGCEVPSAKQAFLETPHAFAKLILISDAEAACIGAHGFDDGAVIIAGTGVVGFKRMGERQKQVGGHGFPHDDEGGGAWLGLQAVRVTLQWLDGRLPASHLGQAIDAYFNNDQASLVSWANSANSTAFAELAPFVAMAAAAGDITAISLFKQAACFVERVAQSLGLNTPFALIGGLIPHIEPYLSSALRQCVRPALAKPAAGAIQLLQQQLNLATHERMTTA